MSTPLTEQEREALRAARPNMHWIEQAVEAIVAARVAAVRDRLLGKVEALANSPDDTQWWPVVPYRDDGGNEDDEVVEVHVVNADRLRALVAEERTP